MRAHVIALVALAFPTACSEPAPEAGATPLAGAAGVAVPTAGAAASSAGASVAGAAAEALTPVAPQAGAAAQGAPADAEPQAGAPEAGSAAAAGSIEPVAGIAGMDEPVTPAPTGGTPADPMGMPDPAAASDGCGNADFPAAGTQTIDVGGVEREYIVGLPDAYDANRPYRLVFAWHGLGGTAAMIARSWYGLEAQAEGSAIFIAGQALEGGSQGGFASWAIAPDDSDVDYTRAMLEWAKASYCIDTERVFSIGMSNGGMMANIVGCELGDVFRATAAMSGGGPRGYATTPCIGQVAVWISHGNTDNNVPFSYGEMSRDYWADANGCSDQTAPATPDPCLEYQGCDDGFPVQFCEFDGGHMVPSFAGEAAWAFFERF